MVSDYWHRERMLQLTQSQLQAGRTFCLRRVVTHLLRSASSYLCTGAASPEPNTEQELAFVILQCVQQHLCMGVSSHDLPAIRIRQNPLFHAH